MSSPLELLGNPFHYDSASSSIWWDGMGPVLEIPSRCGIWCGIVSALMFAGVLFILGTLRRQWRRYALLSGSGIRRSALAAVSLFTLSSAGYAQAILSSNTAAALTSLPRHSSSPSLAILETAQSAMAEADYGKAVRILKRAASAYPNSSDVQWRLGVAYARLAEGSELPSLAERHARHAFEKAMAADPRNPRPVRDLLSLTMNPVGGCPANFEDVHMLLERLAALDPLAAEIERERLELAQSESVTVETRLVCAPAQAWRAATRALR
jgi:tetratricopeptide (TPR) repeat protein